MSGGTGQEVNSLNVVCTILSMNIQHICCITSEKREIVVFITIAIKLPTMVIMCSNLMKPIRGDVKICRSLPLLAASGCCGAQPFADSSNN